MGITTIQPGSLEGFLLVVSDMKAVREELLKRGTDISEIDVQDWGSFAYFQDPDGNRWSLQQLPSRTWLPRSHSLGHFRREDNRMPIPRDSQRDRSLK
jgi:hypothetical protein